MILYSQWTSQGIGTRSKIAEIFNIPKVRSTHVSNNKVVDDGYNIEDVERAINVPDLQIYLNSTESDLSKLLTMLVDFVEGRLIKQKVQVLEGVTGIIVTDEPVEIPIIKKRGRTKKSDEKKK